ncbi:MAG: metallophosphoesterase family protein [Paludibacter sp.]|nr:metallophosphoesterase family protein [Paludibacter sp.]
MVLRKFTFCFVFVLTSIILSFSQARIDLATWDFSDLTTGGQLPVGQLNNVPYPANSGVSKSTALLGTEQMFNGTDPVTRTWSAPSATNYVYCNKSWASDGTTWYQMNGINTIGQTKLQFSSGHATSSSSAAFTFQLQYRINETSDWTPVGNPITVTSTTTTNGLTIGYDKQALPVECEGTSNLQLRLLCTNAGSPSGQARIDNITLTAEGEPGTGGGDINDPIPYAEALNEVDWSVPDWTKMLVALKKAKNNASSSNLEALKSILVTMQRKDVPYSVNAAINGDPATQIGLAWYTNANIYGGKAQIVQKSNAIEADFDNPLITVNSTTLDILNTNYLGSGNSAVSSASGLPSGTKRSYTSNKALINDLTPNTVYSYRVGKEGAWSDIRTFKTAKTGKDDFSFIYITDTQANTEDNFNISKTTLESAYEKVQNPEFVLVNGDLVETKGTENSEWEYEQWFDKMSNVISKLPLVLTTGNHDISPNQNLHRHVNTSLEFDQNYLSATSTMPGMTYSFVMGDALIFVVNFEDYGSKLYMALDQYMTSKINAYPDKKWRIMFYHNSLYTGGNQHHDSSTSRDIRNAFSYYMNKHRIDLALHGHSHVYEVIGPVKHADKTLIASGVSMVENVPVSNPSNMTGKQGGVFDVNGGTLFVLNNSAGKKKYTPLTKAEMDSKASATGIPNYWNLFSGKYGQTGEPTFSDVKITTDTIFIATYTVNDTGQSSLYDNIKVVRNTEPETGINHPSYDVNKLFFDQIGKEIKLNDLRADRIEVYNAEAQMVASASNAEILPVPLLARGIYIVRVRSLHETFSVKLFIP